MTRDKDNRCGCIQPVTIDMVYENKLRSVTDRIHEFVDVRMYSNFCIYGRDIEMMKHIADIVVDMDLGSSICSIFQDDLTCDFGSVYEYVNSEKYIVIVCIPRAPETFYGSEWSKIRNAFYVTCIDN